MAPTILPGATIGVLGGGQLGRMLCVAARSMGYQLVVFDPDTDSPAGRLADKHICADFTDHSALDELAGCCDVITTEFENIPADSLRYLAQSKPVFPDASALEIAQHRASEKKFATEAGLQPTTYCEISSTDDIAAAIALIGMPAILKSATLGYDGKGQAVVTNEQQVLDAFDAMGKVECVLEKKIEIDKEISVIVARNARAETACFPPAENVHVGGVLHTSAVPARVDAMLIAKAKNQAVELANSLNYVGVLAVEFFITSDGELLFNEMAPRPHNSGHYTKDACVTSQFEQQTRMICGLPVGDTRLTSPVVMVNMLGDLWQPDWNVILEQPSIKLHLYGKKQARPGRKMGHFNVLAEDVGVALTIAEQVFSRLVK
jgi:5-(carboxyamino)imidazole ribonucleotide synthase